MVSARQKPGAIIQARMGSTRLPGKVMMPICGKPVLHHIVERLQRSCEIGSITVATTTLKEDDVLEDVALSLGVQCHRGEVQDVLARYYGAALHLGAEVIARVCGDDPLIDPSIADRVAGRHFASGADYTSTGIKRTFPLGVGIEVFSFRALKRAHEEARVDYERQHVTPYIYTHREKFAVESVEAVGKLRRPDLRLTVDTDDDLRLVTEIFARLYRDGEVFSTENVIDLLDGNPGLAAMNAHVRQKRLGE